MKSHIYKGDFMKFKPLHDRVLIEVLDSAVKKLLEELLSLTQHKKNLKKVKLLQLEVVQKLKMEK